MVRFMFAFMVASPTACPSEQNSTIFSHLQFFRYLARAAGNNCFWTGIIVKTLRQRPQGVLVNFDHIHSSRNCGRDHRVYLLSSIEPLAFFRLAVVYTTTLPCLFSPIHQQAQTNYDRFFYCVITGRPSLVIEESEGIEKAPVEKTHLP
jgi:hypothetical protein